MQIVLPTVVPKVRTIAGEQVGREKFSVEMLTQSLADVRAMLRQITIQVTAEQIALDNPPQILEVDGKTARTVDEAMKKTVVLFGNTLSSAAMRQVEIELRSAIARSTTSHTGRLLDVGTSWQWRFIPKGGAARTVTASSPPTVFAAGDALVLMPVGVPYATITNRNVARSGRLNRAPKPGKVAPKSSQNLGFLATAARAVRRRPDFKQFSVIVEFSRTHMVPGELMTRTSGTGMITIRARRRAR
jgi:hypothetical protein